MQAAKADHGRPSLSSNLNNPVRTFSIPFRTSGNICIYENFLIFSEFSNQGGSRQKHRVHHSNKFYCTTSPAALRRTHPDDTLAPRSKTKHFQGGGSTSKWTSVVPQNGNRWWVTLFSVCNIVFPFFVCNSFFLFQDTNKQNFSLHFNCFLKVSYLT